MSNQTIGSNWPLASDSDAASLPKRIRTGGLVITLAGLALIISMADFLQYNFGDQLVERGLTLEQVNVTKEQARAFNKDLVNYISHLHIAIAGYGMGVGIRGN